MRNPRSPGSLWVAGLLGGIVFIACFWMASRIRQVQTPDPGDELAWVCREFQLSDAEVEGLRAVHHAYRPRCEEMCGRLDAKCRELTALLSTATNVSPAIERTLGEVAALRAECQAQMLRYFQAVARTMPEDRGARYLSEMYRLTLGIHPRESDAAGQANAHEPQ